jgi:hypothetical protein
MKGQCDCVRYKVEIYNYERRIANILKKIEGSPGFSLPKPRPERHINVHFCTHTPQKNLNGFLQERGPKSAIFPAV